MLKISIITPSFNQAELLEDTITSVLSQGYPDLEYIIIDGGSTDGSVEIIKKYSDQLAYWVSEPDKGRGDAVNKGFNHATGEIMGWMGCGDTFCPWAFRLINDVFNSLPQINWLTSGILLQLNTGGEVDICAYKTGFSQRAFFEGMYLPLRCTIQQESTFWRRALWDKAGGYVDENFWIVPDFELWFRFWQQEHLYTISVPLGATRKHTSQKKFFRTAFEAGRAVLKKYHKNKLVWYYYDFTYFLSRLFFLEKPLGYSAFIVDYDFTENKWLTKKTLL